MAKTASTDFQRSLAGFIRTLAPEHAGRIRTTTRLFESGVIDSQKVLDLISYVENETGIHIPDEKITLENFRSILAITNAFWKQEESSR